MTILLQVSIRDYYGSIKERMNIRRTFSVFITLLYALGCIFSCSNIALLAKPFDLLAPPTEFDSELISNSVTEENESINSSTLYLNENDFKTRIACNPKLTKQSDIHKAILQLKSVVKDQYIDYPRLSNFNKTILDSMFKRINELTIGSSPMILNMEISEAVREYLDLAQITTFVVHSQAWLSPAYNSSPLSERGILQGENYSSSYERDDLDPWHTEDVLLRNLFKKERGLLFRSSDALISDILNACLSPDSKSGFKNIYMSPHLNPKAKSNIERIARSQSDIILSNIDQAGDEADDYGVAVRDGVLFISPQDVKNEKVFIDNLMRAKTKGVHIKRVFLFGVNPFEVSENFAKTLADRGTTIYGMYDIYEMLGISKSNALPIPAQMSLLVAFDNHGDVLNFIPQLINSRKFGSNIDNFSEWYLQLLLSETNKNDLDRSAHPGYHEVCSEAVLNHTAIRMEIRYKLMISRLNEINFLKYSTTMNTAFSIYTKRLKDNLRVLTSIAAPRKNGSITVNEIRDAMNDYRTLLKYFVYFKWHLMSTQHKQQECVDILEDRIERKLEQWQAQPLFNNLEVQTTDLVFSSGMGVVRSLFDYLASVENNHVIRPKILVGNNIYYEVEELERVWGNRLTFERARERNMSKIVEAITAGDYNALLIDPISNSLERPFAFLTGGLHIEQEDLPVADMQYLIDNLQKLNLSKPFYLVIDVSAFPDRFNLLNFLHQNKLPQNLHIITYGSLQKMFQDGMELSTGGELRLYSSRGGNHEEVANAIKISRQNTGSRLSLLSAIAFDALWGNIDFMKKRNESVYTNTEELVLYADALFDKITSKDKLIHPALTSHPDNGVWKKNGSIGLPYFMFRLPQGLNREFAEYFHESLQANGLGGLYERDSFGFSQISLTYYYPNTPQETSRYSLGEYSKSEMVGVKKAFAEAYIKLCGIHHKEISALIGIEQEHLKTELLLGSN